MKIFVLLLISLFAAFGQTLYPLQLTNTIVGTIHGYYDGDFVVYKFPYARLTNESTKFSEPALPEPGVWNITDELPSCLQNTFVSFPLFSPNNPRYTTSLPNPALACEFMEVRTNKTIPPGNKKRNVEIHVHSGAYSSGHGTMPQWARSNYILSKDLIWAGFQHQLHAFGFINLPGLARDIALKQILLAFEVVQSISSQLQGRSNEITARGQSGGSAKLIQLMADNTLVRKLKKFGLKTVILSSPAPVISVPEADLAANSVALANSLGCTVPENRTACFVAKNSFEIATTVITSGRASKFLPSHGPTSNFADRTTVLYAQGAIDKSVKVMIGNNNNEGEGFIDLIAGIQEPNPTIPDNNSTNEAVAKIEQLIGYPVLLPDRNDTTPFFYAGFVGLSFEDFLTPSEISSVTNQYSPTPFNQKKYWYAAAEAAADGNFNCMVDFLARCMDIAGVKVYRYILNHVYDNAVYPNLESGHGSDHPIMWQDANAGYPQVTTGFTTREVAFVNKVSEFISNFQRHQDPTHQALNSQKWKRYRVEEPNVLSLKPFEGPISDYVGLFQTPAICTNFWFNIYNTSSF